MRMDITRTNLKVAFGKPGCPICRLRAEAERRYVQTLLYEYVNDGDTRLGFMHSQGLCSYHAWFVQANEQLLWDDGLKTAIIYESLGTLVHTALTHYLVQQDSPPGDGQAQPAHLAFKRGGLCRWLVRTRRLGRWLATRLFQEGPAEALLADLSLSRECPICKMSREREEIDLRKLMHELADPQFRAWFSASDGLCLPHLRNALAYAPDKPSARLLAEIATGQLTALLTHLRAYMDKHRWQDHPELRTPWEEASWIRMVAFFAGESRDDQSESLRRLRQQALCNYSAALRARDKRGLQSEVDV
jgi:hypothetical protein